jgi:hypothetical protein
MIAKKYKTLLDKIEPFVFSNSDNFPFMEKNIFDKDVTTFFDCKSTSSEPFYKLLRTTDKLAFSDLGMAMEGWVYFDCSSMPGAIIGFGIYKEDLPENLRAEFDIDPNYNGLVPISMFIAIPTMNKLWIAHNLSSLRSRLGDSFGGLGLLTKAFGIKVLKIKQMYGATQWGSDAIFVHSKLAAMKILTARTPVHTYINTMSYFSDYSEIDKVLSEEQAESDDFDFLIGATDTDGQISLQEKIENGDEFTLIGKPITKDDDIYYKIKISKSGIIKKTHST